MTLFKLPLPTKLNVGSGGGGGDAIVNNNSSVTINTNSSGKDSVVINSNNQPALTVTPTQNIVIGNITAPAADTRLVIKPTDNGNCITFQKTSDIYSTISLDTFGDLTFTANGNSINIVNSDVDIKNHDGSTTGLKLNGTLVTASAQQLNYNNCIPGTASGQRSLVTDSNKNISNINRLSATEIAGTILTENQPNIKVLTEVNITTKFNLKGIEVLATASQLNSLNTVPGTASASKFMLLDENRTISNINSLSAVSVHGTLGTASQPNITSIGYLSSLCVDGDVGIGTSSPSAKLEVFKTSSPAIIRLNTAGQKSDLFTDTSGNLNIVPAGTTILFGNNKSLVLSGSSSSIDCGQLTASRLTGTIQTATQPNITELGTLSGLSITGRLLIGGVSSSTKKTEIRDAQGDCLRLSRSNTIFTDISVGTTGDLLVATSGGNMILGNDVSIRMMNGDILGVKSITALQINGVIQTPAQPNITSIGTLINLSVSNAITSTSLAATTITGTIQTAAQPNITSIGTLTNLSVSTSITSGSIITGNITGVLQTGSQPNITSIGTLSNLIITNSVTVSSVLATSITGTIQTPIQPNITSIGTLSSLSVSNSVSCSSLTSSSITGTIQTSNQPNITNVGTLLSLTVTGAIRGAVLEASTVRGTITTATQPNITSIGTLSSLIVSGSISTQSITTNSIMGTLQTSAQPMITSIGHLTRMTTSGIVGIGTNDPSCALDIITSSASAIKITRDSKSCELCISDTGDMIISSTSSGRIVLSPGTSLAFSNGGGITGLSSIAASTLTGTLMTPIQTNITKTGTLSSLDISGNLRVGLDHSTNYKMIVSANSGECLQLFGNSAGVSSFRVLDGDLHIAPSNKNIRLSSGTNLVLNGGTIVGFTGFNVDNLDTTITKASQPNITSLGTLSELNVNGVSTLSKDTGNALVVNGRSQFNGDTYVSGVSTVLGSAVFLSGITTSSIISTTEIVIENNTSISGNLNVDGAIYINDSIVDFDSIGVGSATIGTVETGKLFITDSNLNLEGFNSLRATNLYGCIKTPAQPSITSLGTLTSLNVSGYVGIGNGSPESKLDIVATDGKCLKLSTGSLSLKLENDEAGSVSKILCSDTLNIVASNTTINKISIGNTSNRVLPMEIGFSSFNFNQAYAYNNNVNGHGTVSSGSTFVYNYSIRALGRILCTQSVDVTSDRRAKKDIQNLDPDYCEKFIENTQPVKFRWKNGDTQLSYGYIAQDLLKHNFADLVGIDPDDTMRYEKDDAGVISPEGIKFSVSYNYVIPILAQNQKKVMRENRDLKYRIQKLEELVSSLLAKIS